ncbi:uncharacterized protein LOC142107350 [Mixophyes fleayi]|uniref:uncharacterized protein LOC142107350 n=1 Tax=Mixophyes fleayi TaxID=3061075 RepID=UPI003F4DDC5A
MDPQLGIEVGAEVELNDGTPTAEDSTAIKVENKQDLPLWHHLHYSEDSSSDESLDYHHHEFSIPPEVTNLDILNYGSDIKSLIEEKEELESKISVLSASKGLHAAGLHLHDVQRGDELVVWDAIYNKDLQDQAFELAPGFEETEISHTEIIPALDYGQPPSNTNELYSVTFLSPEEDRREGLGKYSYYNAKTQLAGTVKPWVRNHKCPRCGRQFGRLYNLEKHICIKTALGFPQQSLYNVGYVFSNSRKKINVAAKRSEQNQESMNRLENMCVEAQKQLQSLQGNYRKEEEYVPLPSIAMEGDPSDMQTWSQEGLSGVGRLVPANKISYKGTVTCHRCGHKFRSRCNLEFHVCRNEDTKMSISQKLKDPQNTSDIGLANSVPIPQASDSDTDHIPSSSQKLKMYCTSSDHSISPGDSKENSVGSDSGKAVEIFKCQQCKRVYNKRCSYATHIRWHMKERDFASSVTGTVGKTTSVADSQEPDSTTLYADVSPAVLKENPIGSHKKVQTYTCQHCGTVFNKHCSYATHTRWHLKEREASSNVLNPTATSAKEGEETRHPNQAPCVSVKQLESGEKNASPVKIFSCQHCGRVFNKSCSYATHTRWHMNEKELEETVKAESQRIVLEEEEYMGEGDTKDIEDQQNRSSEGHTVEGIPFSDAGDDDGNFEGLGEQYNLHTNNGEDAEDNSISKPVESSQQRPSAVVPEYVFELVVGTEDVREVLLSKDPHVIQNPVDFRNSGDTEAVPPRPPNNSFTAMKPNEQPIYLPLMLPYRLVTRLLKRPKPPHRCRDCGTRFYQSWRLKCHQHKQVQRNTWKKHRCDCGRSPVGSLHFLRHQLQHLSDTAFICAVCGKSLRGYRQLQAHSWLHPLVSQFQCKCGSRFTQLPKYLWHSLLNKTRDRKQHPTQREPSGVQSP